VRDQSKIVNRSTFCIANDDDDESEGNHNQKQQIKNS